MITKKCLSDYLKMLQEERTIQDFLTTYDSDESSVIYDYANDDERIISEEITYSDDFKQEYETETGREKSKEDYFWNVFHS